MLRIKYYLILARSYYLFYLFVLTFADTVI